MSIPYLATSRQLELKAEKVAANYLLSDGAYDSYNLQAMIETATGDMHLRLTRLVMCSDTREVDRIRVPISAWEHIKQEWMPLWFIKRYPVKYRTIIVNAQEVFADLKPLRSDKHSPTFRYIVHEPFSIEQFS
jgi:hypothetical protein